jgi:hypothetical protein
LFGDVEQRSPARGPQGPPSAESWWGW